MVTDPIAFKMESAKSKPVIDTIRLHPISEGII